MMVTELLLLHVIEVCLISHARIVTHMAKRILFVVRIIILRISSFLVNELHVVRTFFVNLNASNFKIKLLN